jgi:predicted SAM-dependent methyltransferase
MSKCLNVGCGERFLPGWTNVDFAAQDGRVLAHDLRTRLPFGSNEFAFVYQSHVLEHLRPGEAEHLLHECYRVLCPGGLLRVVVPDLEQKARIYLECLEAASKNPNERNVAQHHWMQIELLDQLVRERSGGEMADFMRSGKTADFVRGRIGDEYDKAQQASEPTRAESGRRAGWGIKSRCKQTLAEWATRFLGLEANDVTAAKFRRSGELHLWMYDRASLGSLLDSCGFAEITAVDAFTSSKPDWASDGIWLDVEDGCARKPDSLYMEARREA